MSCGTASRLSTVVDARMLAATSSTIYDWDTALDDMDEVTNLPAQVCGRALLRYLVPRDVRRFEHGTGDRQFVTPTPYAPGEAISWLALPAVTEPRRYVLLLDPDKLRDVYGPRWVRFGGGIEYILNSGFGADAIVNISPDPGVVARWPLEVT